MKRRYFVWLLFIALLLGGLWGCENADVTKGKAEDYKRNHPSASQVNASLQDISPDNKILSFDYGAPYWSNIATYHVATGTVHVFKDIKTKMNVFPSFSHDGTKIVFLGAKERDYARNIYIMNADGSGLRQITTFPETEREDFIKAPSFSPDGKRIIFSRSHRKRERAFPLQGSMHADWDVYEVDIATGMERRLTNYNFYEISWPYYMADGKRFIFSGEGPHNPVGKGPKDFKEYEEKYQKNFVFIMDGSKNDLKPAFVNGRYSYRPSVSSNDAILFVSKTNEMDDHATAKDTYDLFIYKRGKIERLTKLHSYIGYGRLSRDGSAIIFSKRSDKTSDEYSEGMMKSDGTELKEIKIPIDKLKR